MKQIGTFPKKVILVIGLLLAAGIVLAQNIKTTVYVESTHVNTKVGTILSFENLSGWEYGGFFHKTSNAIFPEEVKEGELRESSFTGFFVAMPLLLEEGASMKLNVRAGLANGEHFKMIPSLTCEAPLTKKIFLLGGISSRGWNPTFIYGVSLKI
jgi:hypothetical protein